jgi:K+-transporting ATPase ATPase A chain
VATVLVPMLLAAVACYVYTSYPGGNDALAWLSNKGPHGYTTMLYEYVSSVAGNGSEFSGLGNNTIGVFLFTVIIVLNALSFLPALMLGPITEHLVQ